MSKGSSVYSMRDVAREAGVSVITVSRALRGGAAVKPETLAQVTAAAERLGYELNPLVSTVMSSVRRGDHRPARDVIGHLTDFPDDAAWAHVIGARSQRDGVRRRAEELGFRVENFFLGEPARARRLQRVLLSRNIRGLLLGPFADPYRELGLDVGRFRCVALSFNPAALDVDRACEALFEGTRRLYQELWRRGYRRIGLAHHGEVSRYAHGQVIGGYLSATLEVPEPIPPLIREPFTREEVAAWLARWRPDAVICHGDRLWEWAHDLGIEVPRQLALANVQLIQEENLPMGGWRYREEEMGAGAVNLLVHRLTETTRGPEAQQPRVMLISGRFEPGSTVGEPGAAGASATAKVRAGAARAAGEAKGRTGKTGGADAKAAAATGVRWRALGLGRVARLALEPLASGPTILRPGLRIAERRLVLGGVPFELSAHATEPGAAGWLVRNTLTSEASEPGGALSVGGRAQALHFLHLCGHARRHGAVAVYEIRYRDGARLELPIVVLHALSPVAAEAARQSEEANVQDWWPSWPRFANARTAAHRLEAAAEAAETVSRFAYAHRWANPRPAAEILEVRARVEGDAADVLILLALTVEE